MKRACLLGLLLPLSCATVFRGTSERPPNVVIIFTDDQGWGDVSWRDAPGYDTPNLARLAAEGVELTDFYVAEPVCSASRAALLTGCYPRRIGIRGALGPGAKHGLAPEEVTLAELLKGEGYATAIYGKWHLGHRPEHLPMAHGFDEFYGIPYSNDMWPYHPESPDAWGDLPTLEGEEVVGLNTDQTQFTGDFADRAVDFIERHRSEPFFVYLAHPMPHVPLFAGEEFAGSTERGVFGDVIAEIDASVGAVLDALERTGNAERTLVVFTCDNGPWLSYGDHAGSTGGLREGKGTTFEGGVRVPFVARYPGWIPAGHRSSEPVMTIDLLPTIAALVDAPLPPREIDGRDIGAVLTQPGAKSPHEALFFYYHRGDLEALRSGRWKLHFPHRYRTMIGRELGSGGIPGKYDHRRTELELYDLAVDPRERQDVAAQNPAVVAHLTALADGMRRELGDTLTQVKGTRLRAAGKPRSSAPDAE